MSQTIPVAVSAEPEFWQALAADEMSLATALLEEALLRADYGEISLLAEHLGKYITTVRGVFVDESETISEIDFEEGNAGGSIGVSFDVSVHMGCKDIDGSDEQEEKIRFSLDADKRVVWLHVLECPLETWDE